LSILSEFFTGLIKSHFKMLLTDLFELHLVITFPVLKI